MKSLRPGYLWLLARNDWRRGWKAAWNDHVVSRRILSWNGPKAGGVTQPCPVHVLAGKEQFRLMLWMLAGWLHFTERNWEIVIHDDGTLDTSHRETLDALFPGSGFWSAEAADLKVEPILQAHPQCLAYRRRHPLARKIFDIPLLTTAPRFLILDTDVLFFQTPERILEWVDQPEDDSCWFNRDFQEPSPVPLEDLSEKLGFPIWEQVNSGLCLINRSTIDLPFCESSIKQFNLLSVNLWRVEQLLFALCASKLGRGGLLPPTYEISVSAHANKKAVARHYVGAVRDRFYAEGVARLSKLLLP